MPEYGDDKVWVVIVSKADGSVEISVYDNEADANNYGTEMQARYHGGDGAVHVQGATLNRRDEHIESDDAPWGALRMDISSEFVEGLMEDMVPLDEIKPGAAEEFARERVDMVRRRALKRIDRIVKDETREELMTHDEWHVYPPDMED
jgi:hypothetical protein